VNSSWCSFLSSSWNWFLFIWSCSNDRCFSWLISFFCFFLKLLGMELLFCFLDRFFSLLFCSLNLNFSMILIGLLLFQPKLKCLNLGSSFVVLLDIGSISISFFSVCLSPFLMIQCLLFSQIFFLIDQSCLSFSGMLCIKLSLKYNLFAFVSNGLQLLLLLIDM